MGSKQSQPLAQQNASVNTTISSQTETPQGNESPVQQSNETAVSSPSKLPFNHPVIDGQSSSQKECPYKKNPFKGIGSFFGKSSAQSTTIPQDKDVALPTDNANASGCPVKHTSRPNNNDQTSSSSSSACPVAARGSSKAVAYNVYSQPIDPTNQMPAVANQLPAPMQKEKLSTERVKSTIPKGGVDGGETWSYPSPQMFYNSLVRKNKLGDTDESDIDSVVAIHNNMNEKTWAKVMEWENVLCPEAEKEGGSKLLKFMGRPSDLSPKARFKNWVFGHPLPFDRHDWTVQRPDGTEVRYVIDYYVDETKADDREGSGMPDMHDRDAVKSILVDVRPAVDSLESALGRAVMMPYARRIEKSTKFEPLPIIPTKELKDQIGESEEVWRNIQKSVQESKKEATKAKSMVLKPEDIPEDQRQEFNIGMDHEDTMSEEEAREISKSFLKMLEDCKKAQKLVEECQDEAQCAKASLSLTMCLAKVVCPIQQEAVANALNADDFDPQDEKAAAIYNERFERALENMTICVTGKSQRAAIAKQKFPEHFQGLAKQ
jgi:cytochrome c heme-lyase